MTLLIDVVATRRDRSVERHAFGPRFALGLASYAHPSLARRSRSAFRSCARPAARVVLKLSLVFSVACFSASLLPPHGLFSAPDTISVSTRLPIYGGVLVSLPEKRIQGRQPFFKRVCRCLWHYIPQSHDLLPISCGNIRPPSPPSLPVALKKEGDTIDSIAASLRTTASLAVVSLVGWL